MNLQKHFPIILDKGLQSEIEKEGTIRTVEEGDILMDYGNYIRTMPLIIKGCIKILRQDEEGNEVFLYYLNAGETCAMALTCCMVNQKSEIKAIAEEATTFISIPVHIMDTWLRKYSSWKDFVMQTYRNRFTELLHTIDSIAFLKMDERLLKYLHDRVESTKKHIFYITHSAIAQEFNTSREVISRLLKQLEKQGKVQLSRNKIKVLVDS